MADLEPEPAFRFRELRAADLDAVTAIERRVFSNPWDASSFEPFLRPGLPFSLVALAPRGAAGASPRPREGAVPTSRPRVAGYALGWCDGEQAELMNLAVDLPWRGRSLGGALLEGVLGTCAARGASAIFLEVRASNAAAQRLYRRHGFRACGRRRSYYDHPREDALVFRAGLVERAAGGAAGGGAARD